MSLFGERFRSLREQQGYSQDGLASLVGAHQTTISTIESDDRLPSLPLLVKLSNALGSPVGELAPTEQEIRGHKERKTRKAIEKALAVTEA